MIDHDPLGSLSSWNDSIHFCEWYGVSCSKRHHGRVTALDLSSQGLQGLISSHIGNLSFLKVLSLYNNSFTGEIPPEIGRLHRLQQLMLSNNSLGGEIPSNISGLSALTIFDVYRNKLVGSLPWQFGLLNKLRALDVSLNNLTGSIPPSFSNLSSLWMFSAGDNLQYLALNFNHLYGEIPPSIFNLSALTENHLHGTIPWNIGISLPNLETFSLPENHFTGSIPLSLSNASNLVQLQLNINNFTGSMPSMASSNKLDQFRISMNSLGSGKADDLNFLSSLINATSLKVIRIDYNHFGGSLPQHLGNLSSILKFLCIADNKIVGNIPSSIQYLVNLAYNMLSGSIPSSLGGCLMLQSLSLQGNLLQGVIPASFSSLREVGTLKNLGILDLSNNMLSGSIPSSMGGCISLQSLYLQGNLLQGIIPSSFSSLKGIQLLDLSANNLSGQIPKFLELMNNSQLLNLSFNNFEGNSKICGGIAELKLPPCHDFTNSKKAMSRKWKIVMSTISSLLFLIFIGSCLSIFLIKKRGKQDIVAAGDQPLLQLSYQRLSMATDGFSSVNLIGEALKNIRHKNLVRIITVCSSVDHQGNDFKALVYEYLANGSLEDWLHNPIERLDVNINFIQRLNISIDIASAIDYLHNHCGSPIVHCDLKPSNILLDDDMVAHVGDFGLARFISAIANPSSSSIGIKGTVGYAPPGIKSGFCIEGDVYSYGVLLLELFTGRRPIEETFKEGLDLHNMVKRALSNQQTMEVLDPILLNELLHHRPRTYRNHNGSNTEETRKSPEELVRSILEIGVACSSNNPENRINMSEVVSRLTGIRKFCPVERRIEVNIRT
ncbi:Probable LRR receptor-like serine/threonine-protein kinase At3g47570 [Linum perenne]